MPYRVQIWLPLLLLLVPSRGSAPKAPRGDGTAFKAARKANLATHG